MNRTFFAVFVVLLVVVSVLFFAGCTEQTRARSWGGSASIKLEPGQKLVVATWKQDNLWLLTRPMRVGDEVETYAFRESSAWGVMEGSVTIVEVAHTLPSAPERSPSGAPERSPSGAPERSPSEQLDFCLRAKGEALERCRALKIVK